MFDLKKYSEKEVVAAIRAVEAVIGSEDFNLMASEFAEVDADGNEITTEWLFHLKDRQEVNLGDIEEDTFKNLAMVVDRLDNYHNDCFYHDYAERIKAGEIIPKDDWDRKVLVFLESEYCQGLLESIDVETYQLYKDKGLEEIGLNPCELKNYVTRELLYAGGFDAVGYVVDKAIAMEILETMSAYLWFEHDGKFYLSDYGMDDFFRSNVEFKAAVLDAIASGDDVDGAFWTVHDSFSEVVSQELNQIKDDMHDIGLFNESGDWQFYLSRYALEYVGLGDELKRFEKDLDEVVAEAVERCGDFPAASLCKENMDK